MARKEDRGEWDDELMVREKIYPLYGSQSDQTEVGDI